MEWLAVRLSDGLCNRLFQIVGGLYHAKKYNKRLVFYVPKIMPSVHSDCTVVYKLFPDIPIVWTSNNYETILENPEDYINFAPLSIGSDERIVIEGYFQNWNYFTNEITFDFSSIIKKDRMDILRTYCNMNMDKTWFLHMRLGDYLILPHHQCTTEGYWKSALELIPDLSNVFLFSDTLDMARDILKKLAGTRIQIITIQNLTAIETLYLMSECGGGCIGSNSTFSWWGMYLSKARYLKNPCILPKKWHTDYTGGPYADWTTIL